MRLVLDSGGVTALADRARRRVVLDAGVWPPIVPSIVLAEALTGDPRRDFHENRLLRTCVIAVVDEPLARAAAARRTSTTGRRVPSAVDAVVAVTAIRVAERGDDVIVLTSDPTDLRSLCRGITGIRVAQV